MQSINNPFISIITPVYNRKDCIGRCIKSVQKQEYENYQHIIINDGSDDGTLDVLKEFQNKENKIKVISYEENRGVNFAPEMYHSLLIKFILLELALLKYDKLKDYKEEMTLYQKLIFKLRWILFLNLQSSYIH